MEFSFNIDGYVPDDAHLSESTAVGTFAHDLGNGYDHQFPDLSAFDAWLSQEQRVQGVHFLRKQTIYPPRNELPQRYLVKTIYVCNRRGNGRKEYQPKEGSNRKVEPKHNGCTSRMIVKTYPQTSTILMHYVARHTHATGEMNLKFLRHAGETKAKVRMMVNMGMDRQTIIALLRKSPPDAPLSRENMITSKDIRRIEYEVEQEVCRFAASDIDSLRKWAERLRSDGHFVFLKFKDEHVAGFDDDVFLLVIQMTYQLKCWRRWGSRFVGLDATHNTTFYENMQLFTLMCRDNWGKGMPAAWMICNSGRQTVIEAFLRVILAQSPSVQPRYSMSDKDYAQMNALRAVYSLTTLFLCWWHVLKAWRQHFSTSAWPELWTMLRQWIRITDRAEFDKIWERIKTIAPPSFTAYLEEFWMDEVKLWSGVYRTTRDIYAVPDTNMLVEAWHRLLKHHFMGSTHGRRVDQLVHVLTTVAIPHYEHQHLRQSLGFEGMDLTQHEIDDATRKGAAIPREDVVPCEDVAQAYRVRSQSSRDRTYTVHVDTACNCTCPAFPRILFCKHVHAVEIHFESELAVPVRTTSALDYEGRAADDNESDSECETVIEESSDLVDVSDHSSLVLSHHPRTTVLRADAALVGRLQADVAWIACRLLEGATLPESPALVALADALTLAIRSVRSLDDVVKPQLPGALPPKKAVGPRQLQQTLTAAAMGTSIKGTEKRKRKRCEYKPGELPEFEAGEESGLKAKPDARGLDMTSSGRFDAQTFDISSKNALGTLIAVQLQVLCKQHGVTTARGQDKTEKMVQRLLAHAPTCECGRAGAAPANTLAPTSPHVPPPALPSVLPPCPGPPAVYPGPSNPCAAPFMTYINQPSYYYTYPSSGILPSPVYSSMYFYSAP